MSADSSGYVIGGMLLGPLDAVLGVSSKTVWQVKVGGSHSHVAAFNGSLQAISWATSKADRFGQPNAASMAYRTDEMSSHVLVSGEVLYTAAALQSSPWHPSPQSVPVHAKAHR